jgi:hypothetical protein
MKKEIVSRTVVSIAMLTVMAFMTAWFVGCDNPSGGNPALTGTVTINGTAKVGQPLTANTGALDVTGAFTYQWERGDTADGEFTAIEGAAVSTYTPVAADLGKFIRVAVSLAGYTGTLTSDAAGPVAQSDITWSAAADGAAGSVTSTAITFTFNRAVSGLTASDITVTGVTGSAAKGALSEAAPNDGTVWTLALTAVTAAGDVSITISKTGVASAAQNVAVYKEDEVADITWTAEANGAAGSVTSTAINFTFSGAVSGLTASDITVTGDGGSVTTGELTGSGTSWSLALTGVTTAGTVSVAINKTGIASAAQNVTVYKAPPITWTATANGSAGTETSTIITFTFTRAVDELDAEDITVTDGTGSATKGTLSGSGTSWALALTDVTTAGDVSVAITKTGIVDTAQNVTVYKGPPQLTADVEFGYTEDNSSDIYLLAKSPTGEDGAEQSYFFSVTEKDTAYFTVTKTAGQTLTLSGPAYEAAQVAAAVDGDAVDGTQPGDTLAVVTVNIDDDMTKYFGGERNFTFTVSETGKASKTININLAAEPDLLDPGCTIFSVTYDEGGKETLTKLDAKTAEGAPVDNLKDALIWIDTRTESGTVEVWKEYLVRLEKDEVIPRMGLWCEAADYVKIRLRGAGEERKIGHDGSFWTIHDSVYPGYNPGTNRNGGVLSVGGNNKTKYVALHLEDKATLDGSDMKSTEAEYGLYNMVSIFENCQFTMEEGSKIMRFTPHPAMGGAEHGTEGISVVVLYNGGAFYMKGGEISDTVITSAGASVINVSAHINNGKLIFHKTGGVFKNTTCGGEPAPTYIIWRTRANKMTVAENDATTEIYFTTRAEFEALIPSAGD